MTPFEMNLRKLKALWRAARDLNAEAEVLRARIAPACPHPEEHRYNGRWEWDNGYGTQKWLKMWRCHICFLEVRGYDAA